MIEPSAQRCSRRSMLGSRLLRGIAVHPVLEVDGRDAKRAARALLAAQPCGSQLAGVDGAADRALAAARDRGSLGDGQELLLAGEARPVLEPLIASLPPYADAEERDSAASDAQELTWSPLSSTVAGRLPVSELPLFQPHRENPAIGFASFEILCQQAGSVRLEIAAPTEAVSLWIDGRPRPTPRADELVNLSAGKHRIVLGVKINEAAAGFGCQVHTEHAGAAVVELK